MSSIAFSVETITDELALELATAYIKGDKDPIRIARILGVDSFDLNAIMHPLTRGYIVKLHRETKKSHSLEEHMEQLAKIRDAALDDENFKVALAAETQLGKAAGHYDPKDAGATDPNAPIDPTKLSTDDLRRRIAASVGAVLDSPKALPEPGSLEAQEQSDEI